MSKQPFNPKSAAAKKRYESAVRIDGRDGSYVPYQYDKTNLVVAVNAALATKRPLLLRGEPGSGKSSVAYDIAVVQGWSYYERVISSRMNASDLLWQFDAIGRLSDASNINSKVAPLVDYIRPQSLWWALDPTSARAVKGSADPVRVEGSVEGAVVLLDEIDKADPDLPNDLLVPLEGRFYVADLNQRVTQTRSPVLVVITSNGERELPPPFLRRCVSVQLATPGQKELEQIASAHIPNLADDQRLPVWIKRMLDIRAACKIDQHRPGTAEVLDAVRACHDLGVDVGHADWKTLTLAMGWKNPEPPPADLQ